MPDRALAAIVTQGLGPSRGRQKVRSLDPAISEPPPQPESRCERVGISRGRLDQFYQAVSYSRSKLQVGRISDLVPGTRRKPQIN
jgi:hypothetical protein